MAAAELEWQEWVIARRRVDTVLAPEGNGTAEAEAVSDPPDADVRSAPRDAAKPKSQVPVWREGAAWSRGWLAEPTPGQFTLATSCPSDTGAPDRDDRPHCRTRARGNHTMVQPS
ncbi:hypothetical protein ACIO02_06670 [Streptomyces sp. NPDC087568]|uniref:hypothetical protein n=1 Tax=Streptomyces sp. NPDC087568 TaxID=3365799 RepID=UPI0037F35D7C